MLRWVTEAYIKELEKTNKFTRLPVNCKFYECPRFGTTCTPVSSHAFLYDKDNVKILIVNDTVTEEEHESQLPLIHSYGKFFRKKVMLPLIKEIGPVSYVISKTYRCVDKSVTASNFCWNHFENELLKYKPEVVICLGTSTFTTLYNRAENKLELPPREEHTINKIQGKMFDVLFKCGVKTKVYVAFHPALVMQAPAAGRFVKEDAQKLIKYFKSGSVEIVKPKIKIENISIIRSREEAYEFFDFLLQGFKEPTFLSFDVETENLNRKFNNKLLTMQFSYDDNSAVVIPVEHKEAPLFSAPEDKKKLANYMLRLLNSSREDTNIEWFIGHYIKFDLSILIGLLGVVPNIVNGLPIWCTHLGMHWLDENRKSIKQFLVKNSKGDIDYPYSLKTLGYEFFGFEFEEEHLEARGEGNLKDLALNDLAIYGGSDVIVDRLLAIKQMELASTQPENALADLEKFQLNYYGPASKAISLMECNGLYVDKKYLDYLQGEDSPIWNRMVDLFNNIQNYPEVKYFRQKYKNRISGNKNKLEYEENLWGEEDENDLPELDLNKEVPQHSFYIDYLKLEPFQKSDKTDKPSLNKKFLTHYSNPNIYKETPTIKKYYHDYYGTPIGETEEGEPIYNDNPVKMDAEYRQLKKLGTTYCDGIQTMLLDKEKGDGLDSRARATYSLAGTDTGRLASANPNFQNLPAGRTPHAKAVKNMFRAENGKILLQADYKTAEVRWAAIFAEDQKLIKIFNESSELLEKISKSDNCTDEEMEAAALIADIHRQTASLMFGIPVGQVPKNLRQATKNITFGLMFGMDSKTLSRNNGWSEEEGESKLKQ